MKLYKFAIYIVLIGLTSCKSSNPKVIYLKNDTAQVLELALRTAFYHGNLPSLDPLTFPYRFKDSILFSTDTLSLETLPQSLDSLNFKILPRDKICSMILADTNMLKLPNYLFIKAFEKSDTGYYVNIESLSCKLYGGGGSIGIYIVNEKGSFIVKSKMSSSIN